MTNEIEIIHPGRQGYFIRYFYCIPNDIAIQFVQPVVHTRASINTGCVKNETCRKITTAGF